MFLMRLKQLRIVLLLGFFTFISLFYKSKRWIVCERGNEARDNGYCFYKYLKQNHPEQKVSYIITKESADYDKVKDDALIFNSVKSFWVIATCEKILSAHYAAVLPLPLATKIFYLFKLYRKFYYLQHGIIKDDLKVLYASNAPMRLLTCGAKPEYEDIKKNYGHPEEAVQYTGLARFDQLHDVKTKRQIYLMPTWRTYIQNEDDLIKSKFFETWQRFLNDEKLNKCLEDNNVEMYFYAHYEMQKYLHLFNTVSNKVIIAKTEDYDIQKLLRESALLITDYSSIAFDFAYMKKPMVFYQFDEYHYQKGYFDYETMGFGKVLSDNDNVVDAVCDIINNNFELESLYQQRVDEFFPLRDTNNCERIYRAAISIK